MATKVLVTGGTGLLGRAVMKAFEARKTAFEVVGTAFSRSGSGLIKVDLTDSEATRALIHSIKPKIIIHCAAERRPDVAQKDPDAVKKLNQAATAHIANLAVELGAWMIYISSDYVFDGLNPPYEVDAVPRPLQFYGETKLAGEQVTLQISPSFVSLRVPVLYGAAQTDDESAVNVLVSIVKKSNATVSMDDFQRRYPTNVSDVAKVLLQLSEQHMAGKQVSGIYHYTAEQMLTKYGMCEIFAGILGLSISHLVPLREPPREPVASRPNDCHLSTRRLKELGIDVNHVDFKEWWTSYLKA